MIAFPLRRQFCVFSCLLLLAVAGFAGCGSGSDSDVTSGGNASPTDGSLQFLSIGTAPIGGTFPIVGDAIAQTLNTHKGANNWKAQAKGTKGSQENIRRLVSGDLQLAISNAAITYFASRGESSWDKKYDVKSVVTMAPNVAMFVTKADSGIKTIADLKGKRVVIGPAGAGFEMFVEPILEAHGVKLSDIDALSSPQGPAVDMLGDGDADAAFLGGALPAASISQACSSFDVHFIPYEDQARKKLIDGYRFFFEVPIKAGTYPGQDQDLAGLNVGSMHVITSGAADEEQVYQITKTIWENRADIAAQHGAGKAINEKNAARDTGTAFHPGAVRFYQEIGLMPKNEADETTAPVNDAEGEAAPAADGEKPADAE
jgi:uncharacterized protein